MLESLHQESFAELADKRFQVMARESEGFELVLASVTGRLHSARQEAFSLIFRGPAQPQLQQGTYHLHNAVLGELDLFLVPVGRNEGGIEYEAVFNRLIPRS